MDLSLLFSHPKLHELSRINDRDESGIKPRQTLNTKQDEESDIKGHK